VPTKTDSPQAVLHHRLHTRRAEIEQAILARVYGVSDPTQAGDPTYLEGLRAAVTTAIDYGLESIVSTERNPPRVPPVLLVQARIAARSKISLDTVLRRYFAGYALLGDFVLEEAEDAGMLGGVALKRLMRAQAAIFDRLLAAIGEEHARGSEDRLDTAEERRAELVVRLLAGEWLDASELTYELEATHLGLIAKGPGAPEAIRELAEALDRRLLLIRREEEMVWAWLGGRRGLDPADLQRLLPSILPPGVCLALGEPGKGTGGWRLSHRQALAALPIALRSSAPSVRYADVALLASILQDNLLATSLREIYLAPLEEERDGGEVARETLRAYFTSGCNVSSAAATLGVNRHTVTIRLRAVEERLGRSLGSCSAEIDTVLRLEGLGTSLVRHSALTKG
jgi:PucR C-terminal helix-turn-helix domain/GGDEF-like domain